MTPRLLPPALALVVVAAAGCGGAALHPVEGVVLVGGRPAAGARVAFHPIDPEAIGVLPVAVTGSDGRYRLVSSAGAAGAPAGEYVVTVLWPDESVPSDECLEPVTAHDRLNARYADPATTRLRASVAAGRNEIPLKPAVGGSWNVPRRK